MKSTKLMLRYVYFLSWVVCLLPNTPVNGQSYDDPSNDEIVKKIITIPSKDVVDTTCDGYTRNVEQTIEIVETVDEDSYNPDDYDSGDY